MIFCFKLGKNARETYRMLQTAFQPSCMNRASVFEWHKRFKEGWESVRDDERSGRNKEVRTPELIGQIKNFMDKGLSCVYRDNKCSLMSVWELYTQLFARNWRCGRFARSLSQGCSEKIRKKDIVMTAGRWLSWSIQILEFLMLWRPAIKAGSTAMTQRPRDRVPSGSMLALPDPRRLDRANPPTNFWWSLFLTALAWSTCTGFSLDSQQGILCWGFKGVQEEIPSEEASILQIGSVAFPPEQCTSLQLHPCHWQRWASRQFLSLPIVQTLLPETFAYSLSSRKNLEAVITRQLRKWKRLWWRSLTRSHKRTSIEPSRSCWNGTSALQPEEITSKGTRVSCVYYQ